MGSHSAQSALRVQRTRSEEALEKVQSFYGKRSYTRRRQAASESQLSPRSSVSSAASSLDEGRERVAKRRRMLERGQEEHTLVLSSLATLSLFFNLVILYIFGSLRDRVRKLLKGPVHKIVKGYAPICWDFEDFYVRRMYRRVVDCFNRPINSSPGAWMDVMERRSKDGNATLEHTGRSMRVLNLGSYNYLGFAASDPYCTPRAKEALRKYGWSTCANSAGVGTLPVHRELERTFCDFLGVEAAMIYGMGFATNTLTIPCLVQKGDLVLSDEFNHKSIVEGIRHSGAKVKVFRHNDTEHLEQLLKESIARGQPRTCRPWKKVLIIVEGVYSMEGELCLLPDILELKKKYKAYLYLDEAHSIGAMGPSGRGACDHFGIDPKEIDVMMGTFTKSFGSCGGYIAGSKELVDHIRTSSPGSHYATSISPPAAEQVISALKLLRGEDGSYRGAQKLTQLHDNANFFRDELMRRGFQVLGDLDSPVVPVMIYHPAKFCAFSRLCLVKKLAVVVVGFPATGLFLGRVRFCVSAAHSMEDMRYALDVITEEGDRCFFRFFKKEADKGIRNDAMMRCETLTPGRSTPGRRR